jgi:membrane protein implicated in regulation of membrane protease activity
LCGLRLRTRFPTRSSALALLAFALLTLLAFLALLSLLTLPARPTVAAAILTAAAMLSGRRFRDKCENPSKSKRAQGKTVHGPLRYRWRRQGPCQP